MSGVPLLSVIVCFNYGDAIVAVTAFVLLVESGVRVAADRRWRLPWLRDQYDISGATAFSDRLRSDRLARDHADQFERVSEDCSRAALVRYRLDSLIVSDRDSRIGARALAVLGAWSLTPVGGVLEEGVEMFRVGAAACPNEWPPSS